MFPALIKTCERSLLFLSIVLAELLIVCALFLAGRMIVRHDALNYLISQYYVLNNSIVSGEIPQWMPFMMQGSATANWVFFLQGSLLQHALLLAGNLLPRLPFLAFFYAGIFADTLLFLTGTWFLAGRFFRSARTAFVVTVSASGSLVWVTQPWLNFHFIFAVPMILHCLHSLLETGRWRYLALAGSLFALQLACNPHYFAPVTSLVIFLYFFFYSALNLRDVYPQWRKLRWGPAFWAALAVSLALVAAGMVLVKVGTGDVVMYNFGRSADGTTPLPVFLTYGGNQGLGKWIELILGVSPAQDYTLYMGLLGVSFLGAGLLNLRRQSGHFFLLALVLLGFSTGTWIAAFFYHTWPLMKFFRHLGLITCFIKLCFCFLAGLGFEALFLQGRIFRTRNLLILAALWGLLGILLISPGSHPQWGGERLFRGDQPFFAQVVLEDIPLYRAVGRTGCIALVLALLCIALYRGRASRWRGGIAVCFLALHLLDLYSYKLQDAFSKTVPFKDAPAGSSELVRFQPLPYPRRRTSLLEEKNPRFGILKALPQRRTDPSLGLWQSFLFQDEPGSYFRSDYFQKPLDQLMKALLGQPLDDRRPPQDIFPSGFPAGLKIAGVQEDKIQFFSEAHLVGSEESLAGILRDPGFSGDLLFLLAPEGPGSLPRTAAWVAQMPLSSNQRLRIPHRIERFDSNHLELVLEAPPSESAWLYYSDVYHPFWKATVDGKPVPIVRSNLAYKAIPLEPGARRVHFRFHSPLLSLLERLVGLNALFWLFLLFGWTGSAAKGSMI